MDQPNVYNAIIFAMAMKCKDSENGDTYRKERARVRL